MIESFDIDERFVLPASPPGKPSLSRCCNELLMLSDHAAATCRGCGKDSLPTQWVYLSKGSTISTWTENGKQLQLAAPVKVLRSQWYPEDGVGKLVSDEGAGEYTRLEGKVVRYFRHPDIPGDQVCSKCGHVMHEHGWIDTLEDGHNVCPGDWIITGIQGERYPCKPDIFDATYEPASVDASVDGIRHDPTKQGCRCD